MKRIARTSILVAATVGVVAVGTVVSYASWIAPPSTTAAKARAGSVPSGVTPSAAIQGGKAVVSWSAQEIVPGVKMTAYVVIARDTDATPLPDVAHTVTASGAATESATFTAVELAGGKWKWAIVPKYRTWTGPEGKLSNPKLVVPAAAPATVMAAAVTAIAATGTNPPAAPAAAPAPPTPAAVQTTAPTSPAPKADPATSAPDKAAEPEKTEITKAGPTPSDTPSDPDPSPSVSASR